MQRVIGSHSVPVSVLFLIMTEGYQRIIHLTLPYQEIPSVSLCVNLQLMVFYNISPENPSSNPFTTLAHVYSGVVVAHH